MKRKRLDFERMMLQMSTPTARTYHSTGPSDPRYPAARAGWHAHFRHGCAPFSLRFDTEAEARDAADLFTGRKS